MHLAAQDSELMPKDDDLQFLELIRAWAEQHDLQQAAQSQVATRTRKQGSSDRRDGATDSTGAYIRTDSGVGANSSVGTPSPEKPNKRTPQGALYRRMFSVLGLPVRAIEAEAVHLHEIEQAGESGETPFIAILGIVLFLVPIFLVMLGLAFGAYYLAR